MGQNQSHSGKVRSWDCLREAKTIKLADLIDNSKSILEYDPKFAKVYMAEKKLLLEVLEDGDKSLWLLAHKIVHDYEVKCAFDDWYKK